MVRDLSEALLFLVSAIGPDGGRGVGQALRAILEEAVPFDAAEAVLRRPGGWAHSRLDDGDAAVAGDDLLTQLITLRAPLRIDDLLEAGSFPETERRMSALGLRSLLAIPFTAGAPSGGADDSGPEGAIVLARHFGWAFAGASLHFLWPVAGLAGRAFELAIALTALTERTERAEAELLRLAGTPEAHEAERAALRQDLEGAHQETREALATIEDLRATRADAVSRGLDLEAVLGETAAERDALREKLAPALLALESERGDGREMRSRLEAVLGRVAELEAALGEAHARSESLRADLEHAHRETEALRAQVTALATEADAARGQLESRVQEAELDRRSLEGARGEIETVRGEVAAVRADAETARAERDQALADRSQALAERDVARAAEGAESERAEQRSADLQARVSRAEASLQEAEEAFKQLRDEIVDLRGAKEAADAEHAAHVRSLRQELEAAHAAASDKGAALVRAEERCRELESSPEAPRSPEPVSRRGTPGSPRRRS